MAANRADAIVARTIQRAAEQMETEYRAARAADAERLYEAFAAAIEAQRPNVEVLVYVLDLIRFGVFEQKTRELFATPGTPAELPRNGHAHLAEVAP